MARNQEGGVHTQKVTALLAVFLLLGGAVVFGVCSFTDDANAADSVTLSADYAQVGKEITATLEGNEKYEFQVALKDGSGRSAGSVTPSSGTLQGDKPTEVKIRLPSTSGDYKFTVTYKKDSKVIKEFDPFPVKAVDPIKLKVKITNVGDTSINSLSVYFVVDGKKQDDSVQTVSIEAGKSKEVTYDYITKDTKEMKFSLNSDDEVMKSYVKGLGEDHTMFTSKTNFDVIVVILIVVLVALVAVAIWIFRKPVINTGKPKSRR